MVHQIGFLGPTVRSVQYVCDDVKIAAMAIADAFFGLNQQTHQRRLVNLVVWSSPLPRNSTGERKFKRSETGKPLKADMECRPWWALIFKIYLFEPGPM